MIFTHHPRKVDPATFQLDVSRKYEQLDTPDFKPQGFWLEVNGDWRRWCEDENWGWFNDNPVSFDVDTSHVLCISNAEDLDEFHEHYSERTQTDLKVFGGHK